MNVDFPVPALPVRIMDCEDVSTNLNKSLIC